MNELNNREIQIIQILSEENNMLTTLNLAEKIGVTSRTIRSDIKNINYKLLDKNISIQTKQGRGVWLNFPKDQQEWINTVTINKKIFSSSNEKENRKFVIIHFLLQQKDYISIDNISFQLYISRSSIIYEFKEVDNIIAKYGCKFVKNNFGIFIQGSEQKLRSLQMHVFNQSQNFKHNVNIEEIKSMIINAEQEFHFHLIDKEYVNLINYLIVLIYRNINNYIRETDNIPLSICSDTFCSQVCLYFLYEIEKKFNIKYHSYEEILLFHFLSGIHFTSLSNSNLSNDNEIIKSNITDILITTLNQIDKIYLTSLSTDKLLINNLLNHLIPAINRAKYQICYDNPLLEYLKKELTFDYEISLEISHKLNKKFNIHLNENEIGFLTMHIAASIERNRQNHSRLNVNIICSDGEGVREYIKVRLEALFKELNINNIIATRDLLEEDKSIDFLISTIPINTSIPTVFISPFIKDEDIRKIRKCIIQTENKKRTEFKEIINYFSHDISLFQQDIKNKDDAICCIAQLMKNKGYCANNTISSALEREKISSTALGNSIAIPHPFPECIIKSKVGVLILKNEINWDKQNVQIIFFLCIKPADGMQLTKVMGDLFNISNHPSLIESIKKAQNYTQFINNLTNKS